LADKTVFALVKPFATIVMSSLDSSYKICVNMIGGELTRLISKFWDDGCVLGMVWYHLKMALGPDFNSLTHQTG
jgi:hypothetical protein